MAGAAGTCQGNPAGGPILPFPLFGPGPWPTAFGGYSPDRRRSEVKMAEKCHKQPWKFFSEINIEISGKLNIRSCTFFPLEMEIYG